MTNPPPGAAVPQDGGPAFPGAELPAHPNHPTGMSLRDYFAAQTLVAMGTWVPHIGKRDPSPAEIRKARAHYAYAQAEAMIAARERGE